MGRILRGGHIACGHTTYVLLHTVPGIGRIRLASMPGIAEDKGAQYLNVHKWVCIVTSYLNRQL